MKIIKTLVGILAFTAIGLSCISCGSSESSNDNKLAATSSSEKRANITPKSDNVTFLEPDMEATNLRRGVDSALTDFDYLGEKGECIEPDNKFEGWIDLDHMCYLDDYSKELADEKALLDSLSPKERLQRQRQVKIKKEYPRETTNDELLTGERMMAYIKNYYSNLSFLDSAVVYIKSNTCVAAVACVNEKWGTYPRELIDESKRGTITKEECIKLIDNVLAQK